MEGNPRYHIEGGEIETFNYVVSDLAIEQVSGLSRDLGDSPEGVILTAIDRGHYIYTDVSRGSRLVFGTENISLEPGKEPWRRRLSEASSVRAFINLPRDARIKISEGGARTGFAEGEMLDHYIHLLAHLEELSLQQEDQMTPFLINGPVSKGLSIPENHARTFDSIARFIRERA